MFASSSNIFARDYIPGDVFFSGRGAVRGHQEIHGGTNTESQRAGGPGHQHPGGMSRGTSLVRYYLHFKEGPMKIAFTSPNYPMLF